MSKHGKRLILIDGMALAYRGHYALIRNPRITTGQLNTSAIFVFANVLVDLLENSDDVQDVFYNAEIPEEAYEAGA